MKFSVEKMKNDITYLNDQRKLVRHNAYAFIDSDDHCIIIVAGEKRRDDLIELLESFS